MNQQRFVKSKAPRNPEAGSVRLQKKLTIGASNDPLEQEADWVADRAMAASTPLLTGAPPLIQRHVGQAADGVGAAPASVDNVIAGSGRPLDLSLRQDMERRFGHDFSEVRVHSGADAEQSARDVRANAYTVGQNIVFGTARFQPSSHEGRRLIAHELTHVVQQSSSCTAPDSLQRDDDDRWMDAWKREHPAEPKMGSKEWIAAFNAGSPEEAKAREEALARLKAQTNPAIAHTAPPPPPDPMKMEADPVELEKSARARFEADRKARAEWEKNKALEEEKKRRQIQAEKEREEERTSLGASGENEKRRALAGSPVLAIQQQLENSFQSPAEIEAFRKHVSAITPEQFFEAYPRMSLDVYLTLHDYGQVGVRNWKNFVQPPTDVDALMRRALKLKPDGYLSQAHQDELANAIVNGREKEVANELGLSPEELARISNHFKATKRSGVFVDKDPLVMGQGYTGRESGYGAFQMRQRLQSLEVLTSSPLAGIGYGGAALFTDDEQERMAVAGLGANLEGLATGVAGVGLARQTGQEAGRSASTVNQITNVAPSGGRGPAAKTPTTPLSAAEREANVLFGERSSPSSSGGNAAGRGENVINIAPSGQGQFPPPTPITAAKGSRGLPEGLKNKESGTLPLGNLADRRAAATKPPSEPAAQPIPKAVEQQEAIAVGQKYSGERPPLSIVRNEPVVDAATKKGAAPPSPSVGPSPGTGQSGSGVKSTPTASSAASKGGTAPTKAPVAPAPTANTPISPRGTNITIPGTMTETQFKESMKSEPGIYPYVIADANGTLLKRGTASNPYHEFNGYITDPRPARGRMPFVQMHVYSPRAKYQALSAETAGNEREIREGRESLNQRIDTRVETHGGADWSDALEPGRVPETPLITIRRF